MNCPVYENKVIFLILKFLQWNWLFNSKCSGLFLVPLSSKQFSVMKERSWRHDKQEGWQGSSFDLPMDPLYANIPKSWQSWESKEEPLMEHPKGNPILFQNPKYFWRKGRLRPGLSGRGYRRVDILHFFKHISTIPSHFFMEETNS